VTNNGKGIPVVIHKEHKIYIPELIFGHLLTGSNYNDDEKRIVGGRNGYGAKLANVFSNKFIVECGDSENKKKFKMVWKDNMKVHDEGEITPYSGKDFVTVTFYPCFKLFNMKNGLDDDIFALMVKRVYDMAGILPKVKVTINGRDIDIKSFSEYVDMYFDQNSLPQKIFDKEVNSQRWEVIVSITDGEFKQVSFVNSVCTSKGGTHVNYLLDQIVDKVQDKIKKREKDLDIKPFQIKAHIWIFVNCLV
jgi:DNA topoisomerase-2